MMRKIAPILIAFVVMAAITGSVYGQDLNEPNDEIGDATEITFNQTVSTYITPECDEDLYKFYVNKTGILQVKVEEVPSDMKPRIDLYDKNFIWIAYEGASNAGDSITLERDVDQPGWDYIELFDSGGKAHKEEYTFRAILT